MTTRRDTTLDVQGMTCRSCIRHVTDALCELDGVDKVDVQLREGTVMVQHDLVEAPVESLIAKLREAGFESRPRTP